MAALLLDRLTTTDAVGVVVSLTEHATDPPVRTTPGLHVSDSRDAGGARMIAYVAVAAPSLAVIVAVVLAATAAAEAVKPPAA